MEIKSYHPTNKSSKADCVKKKVKEPFPRSIQLLHMLSLPLAMSPGWGKGRKGGWGEGKNETILPDLWEALFLWLDSAGRRRCCVFVFWGDWP